VAVVGWASLVPADLRGGSRFVGASIIPGFLAAKQFFELLIAGFFGTVLSLWGPLFVDFYTMPRTYNDDQYWPGALGMYLTYINLFHLHSASWMHRLSTRAVVRN